ncbi:DUF3237 domain-containing protein [Novosphingobium rosa]|uniref:DUF3237 domain-containing protein n=1 Tax=Novosphingobium rosa TaxID=76978 RepID=UPI00082D8C5A|nr:DUF3237 domain-containing protein [Novosphingobium rosa]
MAPRLEFVCDFAVALTKPHEMEGCGAGVRRIIPIVGGTVSGPLLNGEILNVGADWQTVDHNGIAQLDARYAVATADGAVIEVVSQGIRHVSPEVAARIAAGEDVSFDDYYMRTAVRLDTGHADYAWVNRSLFLATGGKRGATVHLAIYRVV